MGKAARFGVAPWEEGKRSTNINSPQGNIFSEKLAASAKRRGGKNRKIAFEGVRMWR